MGYPVEKEPLEQTKPLLAGELMLGVDVIVQNLMVPSPAVTELWGYQFLGLSLLNAERLITTFLALLRRQ
jgi:hypothetical protein